MLQTSPAFEGQGLGGRMLKQTALRNYLIVLCELPPAQQLDLVGIVRFFGTYGNSMPWRMFLKCTYRETLPVTWYGEITIIRGGAVFEDRSVDRIKSQGFARFSRAGPGSHGLRPVHRAARRQ